jgi:hypothetical protein
MLRRVMLLALAFVFTGCNDTRVAALEKRVTTLEQTVNQLQADRAAVDKDADRRTKLESCVADADAQFNRDIASNGELQRNGTYNVPVPVASEMQRVKQSKIDECKLLYSK